MSIPGPRGASAGAPSRLDVVNVAPATENALGTGRVEVVRVVLVGTTGLDAKLRLDPDAEVVRVRTAMEAIGEISSLVGAPGGRVVILGDDAGPFAHVGSDAARDLVQGLRTIDASVRVLRAIAAPAGDCAPFDAFLAPNAPMDAVRSVLHARGSDAPSAPITTPPPPHRTPRPGQRGKDVPRADLGDESMVRALLRGVDVHAAAMELLRARLREPAVDFVPGTGARPEPAPGEAMVEWCGDFFGVLRSAHVEPESLAKAAHWLGGWMRLDRQHAQLKDAAFVDSLTGVQNRRYFDHFLDATLTQARADRRSVTLLVFDIDDFKKYNDLYGHDAGDEILRETARLMKSVVRPSDRVCRIGGDEFAVIFHDPSGPREPGSQHPASIHAIAERFQKQIREHRFPKLGKEAPGTLSVSGGLATFPWDGTTPADLLRRADELLRDGKQHGKNVISFGARRA